MQKQLFETIANHLAEITALLIALAGGIRWYLQWRSKRETEREERRHAYAKEAPNILDASLESLQDMIDFYTAVLHDCRHDLNECKKEVYDLRSRLKNLITPEVK